MCRLRVSQEFINIRIQIMEQPKSRKVIRDSIHGITGPAIERCCQTAGVKRKSGTVYEEVRGVLKIYMENIIKACIVFMEHKSRKTLQTSDLDAAVQSMGMYLGAGINPNTDKTFETRKSRKRSSKEHSDSAGEHKPHRFKPGTIALREIRYQQKNSDKLIFPRANFKRLTIEIAQDYHDNVRFSASFIELLQLVVENYIVDMLEDANLCAIHSGRQTLSPKDIQLARRIRNEKY